MLKFRITLHTTHPHFGGHKTETWDYELAAFSTAEKHYMRLVGEVGTSGYAEVYINLVHAS